MKQTSANDFFHFDKALFSVQELIESTDFSYREVFHLRDLGVLIQYNELNLFSIDEEKRGYLKNWCFLMGYPVEVLLYPPVDVRIGKIEVQKMTHFKINILRFFNTIKCNWQQNFVYIKGREIFMTRPIYEFDDSVLFSLKTYLENEIKRREVAEDERVEQFRKEVENVKD